METILSRVLKIAEFKGITITKMESIIGASKGVLSRALQNNTDIQSKWLIKLVENYPEINCEWLIIGKGQMLKKNHLEQSNNNLISDFVELQKKHIEKLEEEIKALKAIIEKQK